MTTFPLDATTELLLDGSWVDVSDDVRAANGIQITRGRSDEASSADPSNCSLTLNNRSGDYSPRNPLGTHYGVLGRNTQLRVRTPTTLDNYLSLVAGDPLLTAAAGGWSSYASTPDHASLDVTGDIDIRIDIEPQTWRPPVNYGLAQKFMDSSGGFSRSWAFYLTPEGYLSLKWTPDGTLGNMKTATWQGAIPLTTGRKIVRVTLDVDNGTGGYTAAFYTADTFGGSYTLLGSVINNSATTSIFSGTGTLDVGRVVTDDPDEVLHGKVYGFRYLSGIAGTTVASPDFDTLDTGDTTLTDAQGRVWTLHGGAVIANPGARFHGEVSSWPPEWDKRTGGDAWVPVQAYGIMRRLSQGAPALRSVMYRHMTNLSNVVAYWPCEDADDATELASAVPGGKPMLHLSGDIDNASYDQFRCSDPIPLAGLVQWQGDIPPYTVTGATQIRFLMAVPSAGVSSISTIARVFGTGTSPWWKLNVNTSGELRLLAYDEDDVVIEDTGFVAGTNVNGKRLLVDLTFLQVGGSIEYEVSTYMVGSTGPDDTFSGIQGGRTMGRVRRVTMNMEDSILDSMAEVALGHISVQNEITPVGSLMEELLVGFSGETATDRILRLCAEEDVPVAVTGDLGDPTFLGPQTSQTFLELLREAAAADLGILYEPREFLGLAYRTRTSLYAQDAALTLDYMSTALTGIQPVEDDDATRNDITLTRDLGSSVRVRQETGTLSVLPPPDGVGLYADDVTVSLWRDSYLPAQAAWRLHLGTVDEARYPVLSVELAKAPFRTDSALTDDAVSMDVGSRMVVTNPPLSVPPDDITQIVQGMTETLTRTQWNIDFNCSPSQPWDVAVWDDSAGVGEARYSSDGSTLTAAVPASGSALLLTGAAGSYASTPDVAALDIVGDIDLRAHVALDDWTPASTNRALVGKYGAAGARSYLLLVVATTGVLRMQWTTAGTTGLTADSTVAPTVTDGAALWVRATMDVNNGAAGRDIRFYTSPDGETWTQLGATVTQAGTTSIFAGTAVLEVGSTASGTANQWPGKVSAVEVRDGIGGTVVARPEFGAQPAGMTVFVDSTGKTWTVNSPATIADAANTLFPDGLSVTTPTGPVWGNGDVPYDIIIGGERMTVTAVNGATSPQVFTVVRSVNGIVKGHASGAEVALFHPAIAAL